MADFRYIDVKLLDKVYHINELSFIEFKELGKTDKTGKASDFRELYGIWKDREVTQDVLRQKAWQRKTS